MEELLKKLYLVKDNISTGAGGSISDINHGNKNSKKMVTKYGMSEELGPVEYGENEQEVFLEDQLLSNKICQKKWQEKLI